MLTPSYTRTSIPQRPQRGGIEPRPVDRRRRAPHPCEGPEAIVDRTFEEALRDLPARDLRGRGHALGLRFEFAADGLVANPADTWRCPALHRALKARARELQEVVLADARAATGSGSSSMAATSGNFRRWVWNGAKRLAATRLDDGRLTNVAIGVDGG